MVVLIFGVQAPAPILSYNHIGLLTPDDGGRVSQLLVSTCLILTAGQTGRPGDFMMILLITLLKMLSLSDNLITHD